MAYVPDDVPETPDARRTFLRRQKGMARYEALRNHYQQAMSELHYVPEVQLLERALAALGDDSRMEVLKPFHSLCFNLLKACDVQAPPDLKAPRDLDDGSIDGEMQKRGCLRPTKNNCRGLCGPGCWCWSWFCGDCCWHRGCYEHDLCCKKKPYSTYCLVPIGLTCSGFSDYQKCMKSSWWWYRRSGVGKERGPHK